jgi:subtilisin family serine protease
MNAVAQAYQGKVLGSVGPNTYLVQAGTLTPSTFVSGILSVEPDSAVNPPLLKGGIITVPAGTPTAWYSSQPQFSKAGVGTGYVSIGQGVVIADINSAVDYSHPALIGHLTGGYDFILGAPTQFGLNQSSSSFLDQSSSSFLDQSSSSFLDQSSSSFLDQSSSSFLDGSSAYLDPPSVAFLNQSSSSFLDQTTEKSIDRTAPYHGHGTMVAGVLAAVAPGAMIMPIRAFNDQGLSDTYTISKAIYWAVNYGANVINMSFGTLTNSGTLQGAIQYAQQHGVVLVSSAGNDNSSEQVFPSNYGGVLSVAATNYLDLKAQFSNYGSQVELSAPGVAIVTPYPGGYYAVVSGTSFSSPIVAGEAALILSQAISQGMTAQQSNVANTIINGTTNISNLNPNTPIGGRVNVNVSVRSLTPQLTLQFPGASGTNGQVGTPFSSALAASGGFPPYSFSISTLPSGLKLNTSTGAISGMPTATVSNLSMTATVTDVTGVSVKASGSFNIAAPAPLKLQFPGVNGMVGTPYTNLLTASGGIQPYKFSSSALPAGLTLNAATGAINGTPTAAVNNLSVTAAVSDSTGMSATASSNLNIAPPVTLQLHFQGVNGNVGTPYSNLLMASGGIPPYTFSVSALPAGLTLNAATGAISGTPTAASNNLSMTATVTDSTGMSATASSTINIGPTLKLQFQGVNGTVGTPYWVTLTASGGIPPYTFSSSALPAGLTLNAATGAISGTPTRAVNNLPVTATVTDSTGTSTTAGANINIVAPATLGLQFPGVNGNVGTPYSNLLTASGGIPPYTFSISSLPAGLTLNATTGVISGTPTAVVSNLSVTATVTDSAATSAKASANVSIAAPATLKLQFQGVNGYVGTPYSNSLAASGGIAPYTFSISGLPAGLNLNSATGIIAGLPTNESSIQLTATVIDSTGASATANSSINISKPSQLTLQFGSTINGHAGQWYNNSLIATGGFAPYTFSISPLPAGLSLNTATGLITGMPAASVSNLSVTATVVDSVGTKATATATISIN